MNMEAIPNSNNQEVPRCDHGVVLGSGERCEHCFDEDREDRDGTHPRDTSQDEDSEKSFRQQIAEVSPGLAEQIERVKPVDNEVWQNRGTRDGSGRQIVDRHSEGSIRKKRRG